MTKLIADAAAGRKNSKLRRSPYDANLFGCIDLQQIDRNKLMREEPLLYRELQGVCTLCSSKEECSFAILPADSMAFGGMSPNSAMLTTIGALHAKISV